MSLSLPGRRLKLKSGSMCEKHELVPAVINIQGETDSMGYEECLMCKECYEAYLLVKDEPIIGTCEWCKCEDKTLTPTRDMDEGFSGSLYEICDACIIRQNNAAQEDLDLDIDLDDEG